MFVVAAVEKFVVAVVEMFVVVVVVVDVGSFAVVASVD